MPCWRQKYKYSQLACKGIWLTVGQDGTHFFKGILETICHYTLIISVYSYMLLQNGDVSCNDFCLFLKAKLQGSLEVVQK
jgi:hypothetical protein